MFSYCEMSFLGWMWNDIFSCEWMFYSGLWPACWCSSLSGSGDFAGNVLWLDDFDLLCSWPLLHSCTPCDVTSNCS